jgi:cyclin D2
VCRAYKDPVILDDARVFNNMLDIEEFYVAATNYFQSAQTEIKPHMRKIVTDWMLEVCLDQNCHADVFLLSCNIMDRFLSIINIKKGQFQLVAASTLFIASKLVDPCPISASDLINYTDFTYQVNELLEMELLILSKLKWDLSAITPYDFLEYLLKLLTDDTSARTCTTSGQLIPPLEERLDTDLLKKSTENFIVLCATEFRFSMYPPSMLSSAALAAAASRLEEQQLDNNSIEQLDNRLSTRNSLLKQLQVLTGVELECLMSCVQQIEETSRAASQNYTNSMRQTSNNPTTATTTNENAVNNNGQQLHPNDNNKLDGASLTRDSEGERDGGGEEQRGSSATPTEVFNVDWLCVA